MAEDILRACPLCAGFDEDDIRKTEKILVRRSYAAEETLFAEGDDGDCLYVILAGGVKITKRAGDHGEILTTLKPGQVVGEVSLLDLAPRSAGASAGEEGAETLVLMREDFLDLIRNNDFLAFKLLLNVARILTTRIRTSNERLRNALLWGLVD